MTAQRMAELVRAYAEGPRLLESALAGIPESELRFKPGPEHGASTKMSSTWRTRNSWVP